MRYPAAILAVVFASSSHGLAAPGREAIQASCFAPQALQSVPGEQVPQKLGRAQSVRVPGSEDGAPVPQALRGAIRRVDLPAGSRKLIALTLDFCEQSSEIAGYDGAIIDILRREHVKATLFMGGKYMVSHLARTQQMMTDPLFEIGTHGWVHRNTRGLTGLDLKREILAPSGAYATARASLAQAQCAAPHQAAMSQIPAQPRLYRFPFGACNAEGMNTANDAGLLAIQWDLSTGDPSPGQSARAIAQQMIANARPGSIIIAHANGRGHHTAAALPQAVAALKAKGFEFVTVSELIAAGKPVVVSTCYDSHPGDTDKYDSFFKPHRPAPSVASSPPTKKLPPADDLRTTFPR